MPDLSLPDSPVPDSPVPDTPIDDDRARHAATQAPLSDCPVLPNNEVTLLPDGATAIAAIFEAIRGATETLHLEYYIFNDVHAGGESVVALLLAALARGVRVAVIYDSVGSLSTPGAAFDRLSRAGAQIIEFHPINPLHRRFAWHLNDRDHRKLMVADGKLVIMGGVNLSRVYENPPERGVRGDPAKSFWHDCAIRLTGPAVAYAQRVFLQTWDGAGGATLLPADAEASPAGLLEMRIAASEPRERRQLYFRAISTAIREARSRIVLCTGYFVPSRRHWKLLAHAARRGVAVDLVLPGVSDVGGCLHAQRALYGRLLQAGVRIHELRDGYLHAKAATIDGVWSVIGSSNFDRRSYSFNNEVDAVILGETMAGELEALLLGWAARGQLVSLRAWRERPFSEVLKEYSARVWERYM